MKKIVKLIIGSLFVLLFAGCSQVNNYYYADEFKYNVGPVVVDQNIEVLNIDWIAGNVMIIPDETIDKIYVSESFYNSFGNGDLILRYWIDDKKLNIKYCKSGTDWLALTNVNKVLSIKVPASKIFDVQIINATASDVSTKVCTKNQYISTVSGNIYVNNDCNEIGTISYNTTSGKINASAGVLEVCNVSSISGSIDLILDTVKESKISTTSGSIKVSSNKILSSALLESVSGSARLYLPKESGFTASLSTVSGHKNIDSGFKAVSVGDVWYCGDKSTILNLKTVSGSVYILENK